MRVLMISGDPGAIESGSETWQRIEEYRHVLDELDVLVAHGNIFRFIRAFFSGFRMLRQKEYDVITAQDIEHAFLAWVLSKIYGVPWQMQIHTDILSPYFVKHSVSNRVRVWLARFLIPRASCVRVVSERIKISILGRLTYRFSENQSQKIEVLPIFVDTEKIKNAPIQTDLHEKYGHDKFIILMASRITKEKNIGLAVEVANEILKSKIVNHKSILLLIVGDGPEKKRLQLQITTYKLSTSVVFEQQTNDLVSYYKTCDLFLLTSNYEGYGRTLVEAAAAGAKIISSDVGIAPEILPPECIFEVGDLEDLKNKLASAFHGNLSFSKNSIRQTKEEYLKLYEDSFKLCLKNSKTTTS